MSSISAGTTSGTALIFAPDTAGTIVLKTNGSTTAVTIDTSQNVDLGGNNIKNYADYATAITNSGSTQTIPSDSGVVRYTLTGNLTLTLPSSMPLNADSVKSIVVFVKQDATGSRTVTFAAPSGESVIFNNSASAPTAVTGATKVTMYTCMKFDGDTRWYVSQGFLEN